MSNSYTCTTIPWDWEMKLLYFKVKRFIYNHIIKSINTCGLFSKKNRVHSSIYSQHLFLKYLKYLILILAGWKWRFERYRIVTKLSKEDKVIQVSKLLYTMGNESKYVFTQFALDEKVWWTFQTREKYYSQTSYVSSKITTQWRVSWNLHSKPLQDGRILRCWYSERRLYSHLTRNRSLW